MYKFILLLCIIVLNACEKKSIDHEVVFKGKLGIEKNQIGSNIPILESYTNRQGFSDSFLIDVPYIKIFNHKLYIADSYNKRINVFSLSSTNQLLLSIPNKGESYQFARPYDIWVNSADEIFVLASIQDIESYEVQNYNNQTARIQDYEKFERALKKIPDENFYIFQFSSDGSFIRHLGVEDAPMIFPSYMSGDTLGNFYIGFTQLKNNKREYEIQQFDNKGKVKATFNSSSLSFETNINETNYNGIILSVHNLKTTEKIALVIEYTPVFSKKTDVVTVDQMFSTIVSYDLATQSIDSTLLTLSNITESILDIDNKDRIFLKSFDTGYNTLKIRIIDGKKNSIHYTPINSSYYILFDYFIDNDGLLYNYLIDRKTDLLVLQWYIEKDKK